MIIGGLFIGHGTQKLFGWFGGTGPDATGEGFEKMGLRPAGGTRSRPASLGPALGIEMGRRETERATATPVAARDQHEHPAARLNGPALAPRPKHRHAGGVRRAPLLVLAGLFVAADVALDRLLADRSGTLHHPRPLLVMLPALVLIAVLWHVRDQLGSLGRAGVAMCATGGAANVACTITDRAGVSDYIRFQISHYLIVVNAADVLIAIGLGLVIISTLAAYTHRLRRAAA